ncbi:MULTISPECIES: cache domain-containing sensor histidine kinase [Paenibacillus]|uniref:cache domain-containing sensor histidine kinase n=1 Tax=Paenibacillus TaxID=44249 RepID=UPI00096FBF07|nr:sensor histidine kinase [Paenibacillus odorifer]OMD94683.1 two-component sensor histidine kinase [Paenibacillus odorifer]
MFRKHQSLRKKLVWSSLICVLIPLVCIYMVTDYLTRDLILEKAVGSARESLNAASANMNAIFEQTLEQSNFVLQNSEIRQMMSADSESLRAPKQIIQYNRMSRMLDDMFVLTEYLKVTLIGKNGLIYTSYPYSDFNPKNFYNKNWTSLLKQIQPISTYWRAEHDTYYNYSDKGSADWVTIARPIQSTSSSTIGYLIININERKLRPYLNNDNDKEMMLLDDKGTVVSHADKARIGETMTWLKMDGELDTVEIDGEKFLYVDQELSSNKWRMVSIIPLKAALSKNKQILFISLAVQILFFTLFSVLLTVLISKLTQPIVKLSAFVKRIGRGQLDERSFIRGNNEAAQLARTIDQMLDRIESMIEQITYEQTGKRKAELEMLQAQINPHFMFNLLNSIRLNILMQGDRENAELIGSLSSLLRMTFNRDNEFIPLREETDTISHYVTLMNFRHANQVRLEMNLADGSAEALVPRFMIQPMIENAIIHGFEQFGGEIFIEARIVATTESLVITIKDNGIGMSPETLTRLRETAYSSEQITEEDRKGFSGIGLRNVAQRLSMIYGASFKLNIQSEPDVGTEICLEFPLDYGKVGVENADGNIGG